MDDVELEETLMGVPLFSSLTALEVMIESDTTQHNAAQHTHHYAEKSDAHPQKHEFSPKFLARLMAKLGCRKGRVHSLEKQC